MAAVNTGTNECLGPILIRLSLEAKRKVNYFQIQIVFKQGFFLGGGGGQGWQFAPPLMNDIISSPKTTKIAASSN